VIEVDTIFCLMGSVLLFKTDRQRLLPHFLEVFFKSQFGLEALIARSGSTAQQAIYIKHMRNLLIPLPSLGEQGEIVFQAQRSFRAVDKLLSESTRATALLSRLDQATLAKAFRGELFEKAS